MVRGRGLREGPRDFDFLINVELYTLENNVVPRTAEGFNLYKFKLGGLREKQPAEI
jgi:hypothetical protein